MSDERDDTSRTQAGDRGATMGSTAAYAAFRGWLEAEERAAALANRPDDDAAEYDAAVSASSEAVRALAAAPVVTGRDLALKLYALAHVENPPGRDASHPCALATLPPEPSADDTEDEALRKAIARDTLALWTALERLARGDAGAFSEETGGSGNQRAAAHHPDAALLAAWTRYAAGWRAIDALSAAGRDRDDDPDRIAAYAQMDAAHNVLLNTPWHTPAGLAAKLRRALMMTESSGDVDHAIIYGTPVPVDRLGRVADADRFIATMLQHAEALMTVTAAPAQGKHADAALLEAWRGYVAGVREVDASPSDGDREHLRRTRVEPHRDVIEQTPARTVAGFAVQLRYLFSATVESMDGVNAALFNDPITEELADELNGDFRWRVLWRMAETATRAAAEAGHPLFPAEHAAGQHERAAERPDLPQQPDPLTTAARAVLAYNRALEELKTAATCPGIRGEFAHMLRRDAQGMEQPAEGVADPFGAAVAEFEEAATTALPTSPSLAMVEAGATAAGIGADAVRAVYAAMVQAHQRSAAA